MTSYASINPSSWKDLIIHQDDRSHLASYTATNANFHFICTKSVNDCVEAALVAPEATFFKTAASPNPIIVQGAIEQCRCTDASSVSILKQYGIHHGMGNPADKFRIEFPSVPCQTCVLL